MTRRDPWSVLGLRRGASANEVRAARKRLAKRHHPDRGGDANAMRDVNDAAADALRRLGTPAADAVPPGHGEARRTPSERDGPRTEWSGLHQDVPSFVIEALPAPAFEALLIVGAELGEVLDDDPPYRLDAYLGLPLDCWCRLDVVPDAGASTVSISVGAIDGQPAPDLDRVRDAWIEALNQLDWSRLGS